MTTFIPDLNAISLENDNEVVFGMHENWQLYYVRYMCALLKNFATAAPQ